MPSHRFFQGGFIRFMKVRKQHIQRLQLVEITMPTNGRTRPTVTRFFPVVDTLQRTLRQLHCLHRLSQSQYRRRNIIQHPMHPRPFRSRRIRRVRIIHYQHQTRGISGQLRPHQRRRHILTIASVAFRDITLQSKSG